MNTSVIWAIIISVVVIAVVYYVWFDKEKKADVNKDGVVDMKDMEAAVDKAVEEIKELADETKEVAKKTRKRATATVKKVTATAKKPRTPRKKKTEV